MDEEEVLLLEVLVVDVLLDDVVVVDVLVLALDGLDQLAQPVFGRWHQPPALVHHLQNIA